MTAENGARICESLGIALTEDNLAFMAVLEECAYLYDERGQRHGEGWKDSGWQGMLFDMRKKMDRLWNERIVYESDADDDSALDLINYTVFYLLSWRRGNTGTWRWK